MSYLSEGKPMETISTRTLGRSGIEVSALGLGCWAISGPFWAGELPLGWGEVDDNESIRAIHHRRANAAQGALAWLWARSPKTLPISGFRTTAQVIENSKALAFGPLRQEQFLEVERIMGRA
jgi:aryl-alcohol dehydrogenase-like predicted oxidoreductase